MSTPSATIPGWLNVLRHAVALVVGTVVLMVPMVPGLMPWTAAALLPMTLAYAIVIGLPVAFVMQHRGWTGFLHSLAAGALLGAFPAGLLASLASGPGALVFLSVVGVAVAAASWIAARLQAAPDRLFGGRYVRLVGGLSAALFIAAVVLGTPTAIQSMQGPRDMSCHNPMRDGRRSIGPVANASLDIPSTEWPRLRSTLAAAGGTDGWSVRDLSRSGDGFQRVSLSLCQEPGTNFTADELLFDGRPSPIPGVAVNVYQPQGGESWVAPARTLYRRVSLTWPGKLSFKDGNGRHVRAPKWYCDPQAHLPEDALLCPEGHTASDISPTLTRLP